MEVIGKQIAFLSRETAGRPDKILGAAGGDRSHRGVSDTARCCCWVVHILWRAWPACCWSPIASAFTNAVHDMRQMLTWVQPRTVASPPGDCVFLASTKA